MFCRWLFITPAVLFFVLIMTFIQYSPAYSPSYSQEDYVFPGAIQAVGWLMAFAAPALILAGAGLQVWKRKKNGKPTDWKSMTRPNEKWSSAVAGSEGVKKTVGVENLNYIKDEFSYNKYAVDNGY